MCLGSSGWFSDIVEAFGMETKAMETISLIGIKEAASIMGVKPTTFRSWLDTGKLPRSLVLRHPGIKLIRIDAKRFQQWIVDGFPKP